MRRAVKHGAGVGPEIGREIVFLYIEAHPGCTVREIADHYTPNPGALDPKKAARSWVERRLQELGDRVRVVPGNSRPYRYEIAEG